MAKNESRNVGHIQKSLSYHAIANQTGDLFGSYEVYDRYYMVLITNENRASADKSIFRT